MKYFFSILAIGLALSLSSCLEIIDDLSIHPDGSGNFKYTVNLSSSKVKINSYLALDSLDGKKVPSIEEISARVNDVIGQLKDKEGISNLSFDSDYTDFIFKLSFDFSSLESLQNGVKAIIEQESKGKKIEELDHTWLKYEDHALVRSVPKISVERANRLNRDEIANLKTGKYTSITRFQEQIDSCKNATAFLSKNRKAVMLRTDPYSLIQNTALLDNAIYLKESDEQK